MQANLNSPSRTITPQTPLSNILKFASSDPADYNPRVVFPWDGMLFRSPNHTVKLRNGQNPEEVTSEQNLNKSFPVTREILSIVTKGMLELPGLLAFHLGREKGSSPSNSISTSSKINYLSCLGGILHTSVAVGALVCLGGTILTGAAPIFLAARVGLCYSALTTFLGFRRGLALGKLERN